jgi:hypothetical protein
VDDISAVFEKFPEGADQDALVAAPPKVPAKVTVPPAQTDWSTFAFTVATGFTTTVVVAVEVQPFKLMVNVYVPAAAAVAFGIVGFWRLEEKPFGPTQL